MGTPFAALRHFEQIEEGQLARDLDEKIESEIQFLVGHNRKYGISATAKDTVEITLKIKIRPGAGRRDDSRGVSLADDYLIAGAVTSKRPGRPVRVTRAVHEQEQTGEDVLFVRASGSSTDEDPRQMKLATKDGRVIDPKTGEARPHKDGN